MVNLKDASNELKKTNDVGEKMPVVSVIMNCRNSEKYLREAIDSVYAQTFNDWEIIFWDDASTTDNSPAIAKSYDGKLRYFKGDAPLPLYAARNRALHESRGQYIAFLDCDDMWLPNKLELQLPLFNDPDIGLVYSNLYIFAGDKIMKKKYKSNYQPGGMIFKQMLKHYNVNLQTVMISREAIEKHGHRFDDEMYVSGDADLFLRIAHDWKAGYLPELTAVYRDHGGNFTVKNPGLFLKENEMILKKLSRIYPNFNDEYRREIVSNRFRVQKGYMYNMLQSGDRQAARKFAFRHILTKRLMIVLLIMSFLPFSVLKYIDLHFKK